MTIQGDLDEDFEGVHAALNANLAEGNDLGAGICAIVDGSVVVDIAGGFQDRARTLPFTPETLTCVFSSGKAVCAALAMEAVSKGELDYDQTVASIWPEFAAEGKGEITVAQALSHQAGLPGFVEEVDPKIWIDWDATCAALAAMEPLWAPGTASGYHPQTFGYLAGEILRRVTGKTVGERLRELTDEVICGLSLSEATRVSPLVKPPKAPDLGKITPEKKAAFLEPWSAPSGISRQEWAAAEIPASNMHATARGLAEIMQLFATGRIGEKMTVTDDAREQAWAERINGPDRVLPFTLSWAAGIMRENGSVFGAPPTAVGHYGFGGSCVVADPAIGLSFAYVPNKQSPHLIGDPRALGYLRAVYQALT